MTSEQLAISIEGVIANRLEGYVDGVVTRYTPSIIVGRRYIGFKKDGKAFVVEVNVTEV